MAEGTLDGQTQRAPILDRTINLTAVSWTAVAWTIVFLAGLAIRVTQLGLHPLSNGEAKLASDAYRFIRGQTMGPGNVIPDTGPTATLFESLALFLFGDSDGVARLAPALIGTAMLGVVFLLRPVIGRYRALGMAALLTLSPTIVFLSRSATHEIYVAAFALLTLAAFLRAGVEPEESDRIRYWALLGGVSLAAMYGSGPSSLSVLLAMAFAAVAAAVLDDRPDGAFRRSVFAFRSSRESWVYFTVGLGITLITFFSRFFTDFSALAGLGTTIADWGRLLATASSPLPTQFFLLAILLYELLAVVFAVVASMQAPEEGSRTPLHWSFFALWFAAALLIFSFSSGGVPEHAIHVALPVVLLGGIAIGDTIERLAQRRTKVSVWLLTLVFIGLVIAILAELVMLSRIDDATERGQAVFEAAATIVIAVVPLGLAAAVLSRDLRTKGEMKAIGLAGLAAALVLLGAFTVRSSVMLSLFNADESTELLAQRTSTPAVDQIVHRITNLSRDTTLPDGSARDPEGGHGLTIAIDRRVQWPFRWYFRDFPDATVVSDGQVPLSGAQIVIAPDDTGLAEAGYTPNDYPTQNRVPGSYLAPDFGGILSDIFVPSHWESGIRYLLFREQDSTAQPATVTVGMTGELANRITPNTGPFNLYDQAGAGSGQGQFNQPRGIAVSDDGEQIYVVDMANARVEHFDSTGAFIEVWGDEDDPDVTFAKTDSGLGPTGIAVGPDGLIYVCDTWNHRVVVLNESGHMVREFGAFADTLDSPDASPEPGLFFGPRDIAIANDEIYVVDTGNERVQVFALDGTFLRAFGGTGSEAGQFIEPVGIVIDAAGRVYVADSGNARISIFSATGAPIEQWPVDAWVGYQYFEPYLALDDAGQLYASSSATGSIEVFDQTGLVIQSVSQVGTQQLEQPVGIAWSPSGALLISDKERNTVFEFVPPVLEGAGDEPVEQPASDTEATPEAIVPESSPVIESAPVDDASPAASPMASPIASPIASPTSTPIGNG